MIVREHDGHFVMIEQNNHAIISGELMANWKDSLFLGKAHRKSVNYAIKMHDYGWKYFDKQPLWNDQTNKPYTFSDFPISPKTIVYTHGINEIEKNDIYAALLCSEHFSRFIAQESSSHASRFIEEEKERRQRLIASLGELNKRLFNFHYDLLKLGDSLSLYLCLNEPGVTKEDVHFFFRNGIDLPSDIDQLSKQVLEPEWKDEHTIVLSPFPFESSVTVRIKQKVVSKTVIRKHGLVHSYENTPYEELELEIIPN
ncbi:DUF3891 family protein [Oceanobacillus salinisoli]|uniref:DUF3891 family protein n=1 Tax=Oceanobacillus salinisoli TaxID=2678611 RepID=UPI0012E1DDA1|nr:DUF3891 family protein [Oceanobacillus salinisoli]